MVQIFRFEQVHVHKRGGRWDGQKDDKFIFIILRKDNTGFSNFGLPQFIYSSIAILGQTQNKSEKLTRRKVALGSLIPKRLVVELKLLSFLLDRLQKFLNITCLSIYQSIDVHIHIIFNLLLIERYFWRGEDWGDCVHEAPHRRQRLDLACVPRDQQLQDIGDIGGQVVSL